MELDRLFQENEGKTLEFKRDLSSPDKVLRTLVAFANTAGGTLLIGVEDRTKRVWGVGDPLKEEERLANLISDRIVPRLVPTIEIAAWRSVQIIVVEVYPSPNRPHHLKDLGAANGVFVRIGSTNRQADDALIAEIGRLVRNETFDETPVPDRSSEDLDLRAASELFKGRRKLKGSDWETLRIMAAHQGRRVPTVGGLLLFGKSPQSQLPDAWIQCGRFAGTDKTVIEDVLECRGGLAAAMNAAFDFVKKHSRRAIRIDGLRHSERYSIPLTAARELLVNAVLHADYAQRGAPIRVSIFDDRIEIENPGLLLPGLTVDDIWQGVSRLRNRVIGRVFKEFEYIEQWGSGVLRAARDCKDSGLAAPSFQEMAFRFRATIGTIPISEPQLTGTLQSIRSALMAADPKRGLSTHELADHAGIAVRTMRTHLSRMLANGQVAAIGKNARDPLRRYLWTGDRRAPRHAP